MGTFTRLHRYFARLREVHAVLGMIDGLDPRTREDLGLTEGDVAETGAPLLLGRLLGAGLAFRPH